MTTTTTMTTREFLVAVMACDIDSALVTKASEMLASLDAKNEKRRSADSKEKRETMARKSKVVEFFNTHEGQFTRDDVATACDITAGQAGSACSALVKEEILVKSEIKVDKKKRVVYSLKSE